MDREDSPEEGNREPVRVVSRAARRAERRELTPRDFTRLPQPGLYDDLGEAESVLERAGLLGLPAEPSPNGDGDLLHSGVVPKRLDQYLGAVLILLECEPAHELRAGGSEPARNVCDAFAVQERDHSREEVHAGVTQVTLPLELAEPA